jgi:hypothetical protein
MSSASAAYICLRTSGVHCYCVDIICFVVRRGNCQEIIPFIRIVFILLIISGIMQLIHIFCGVCFLCHSALYGRITSTKSLAFCVMFFVMSLTNLMVLVPSVMWLHLLCKQPSTGSCIDPIADNTLIYEQTT